MAAGAPTKYKKEYCQKMLKFFSIKHTKWSKKQKVIADGSIVNYKVEEANSLPTFEGFAVRKCNVDADTLRNWKNQRDKDGNLENPEFFGTYNKCKNLQKEMLNDLATRGLYNAAYTKFVAINVTDMKDVQHVEQKSNELRKTAVVTKEELEAEEKAMNEKFEDGK